MFQRGYLLSELRRRWGRTLVTALGLAVGVGLVIGIVGVSQGLEAAQESVLSPLQAIGGDILVTRVAGSTTSTAATSGSSSPAQPGAQSGSAQAGSQSNGNEQPGPQSGTSQSGAQGSGNDGTPRRNEPAEDQPAGRRGRDRQPGPAPGCPQGHVLGEPVPVQDAVGEDLSADLAVEAVLDEEGLGRSDIDPGPATEPWGRRPGASQPEAPATSAAGRRPGSARLRRANRIPILGP